jgi:carbon storage regulator
MLVLTRKLDESIQIGNSQITIKIVDVGNGRVRLGIEAPREIRVERLEKVNSDALIGTADAK